MNALPNNIDACFDFTAAKWSPRHPKQLNLVIFKKGSLNSEHIPKSDTVYYNKINQILLLKLCRAFLKAHVLRIIINKLEEVSADTLLSVVSVFSYSGHFMSVSICAELLLCHYSAGRDVKGNLEGQGDIAKPLLYSLCLLQTLKLICASLRDARDNKTCMQTSELNKGG